ncbi:MAG TPA: aldehyde reductase [Polyangiaceae bacterium]|jgi:nucleoside-diphosphate-sugar epimerase|nr:aldehyde reductase [Polyangiaceae bacterium]
MSKVLVTGGSGFIAGHLILQLLDAGHRVRTTIRNMGRESAVRATLRAAGMKPEAALSFVPADLEKDDGWTQAVEGCEYVQHVASPFPAAAPKHDDELIVPAREGALRVLRAAREAGAKRVVLTSSFAAVGYGKKPQATPFDETSWTDPGADGVSAYVKSKTLAERAAWDFMASDGANGSSLELSVVNPVGVFGPDCATSILLVQRLLDGAVPGLPNLTFGAVDVRDVADLHVRAMTHPAAKGERFLATAGDFMTMLEIAKVLKDRLGSTAKRVPLREVPNWVLRIVAMGDPTVRLIVPELGKFKNATNEKARRLLGWAPRSREDAVTATGESLAQHGLLKDSPKRAA